MIEIKTRKPANRRIVIHNIETGESRSITFNTDITLEKLKEFILNKLKELK